MSQPAEPAAGPELKTYHGNCHCGAFKFHIRMPELTSVTECNCSICFKKGCKWIFPGAGCFTIDQGEGTLQDYEFGARSMSHKVHHSSTQSTRIHHELHAMREEEERREEKIEADDDDEPYHSSAQNAVQACKANAITLPEAWT